MPVTDARTTWRAEAEERFARGPRPAASNQATPEALRELQVHQIELEMQHKGKHVKLSEFIQANQKLIVDEWEAFARTMLPAAGAMNRIGLRDHAAEILDAIVKDLEAPQDSSEQSEKSMLLVNIFEPMVSHARQGEGMKTTSLGLGLHIAREIVLAHGGTLAVTSVAEGTTFTVHLSHRSLPTPAHTEPPGVPDVHDAVGDLVVPERLQNEEAPS